VNAVEDRVKAGPLWVRACSAGWASGCYELGNKLNSGDKDHFGASFLASQPAGIVYLGKACKAGLDYACVSTGDAYAAGFGTEREGLKALELYTIACERGSAHGCYRVGHLYEYGPLQKDEKKAADWYKKSCEAKTPEGKPAYGSAKGCLYFGRLLEKGLGVPKDEVQAATFYKKSCDPDEHTPGDGCVDLARIYENGKGMPKNPARAAELLVYGCKQWSASACFALGGRYTSGTGLPKDEKKDEKKAIVNYQHSCGMSPEGCMVLANLSAQGKGGLPKDEKMVTNYWVRACGLAYQRDVDVDSSAAIAQACAKAGAAANAGKGMNKDAARAYDYFSRACDRGDKASCDQAKKIGPPPKK
jgi:TPR repeat protein